MLSVETNIREAYSGGSDDEQNFIQNLSMFLCTYLKEHALLVEKKHDLHPLLMTVSFYTSLF
jgi:exportin-1